MKKWDEKILASVFVGLLSILFLCISAKAADVTVHAVPQASFPDNAQIFINQDNNETATYQYGKPKPETLETPEEKEMLSKLSQDAVDEYHMIRAEYYRLAPAVRDLFPRNNSCFVRAALMNYLLNEFIQKHKFQYIDVKLLEIKPKPDNPGIHQVNLIIPKDGAYKQTPQNKNYCLGECLSLGKRRPVWFSDASVLDPSLGVNINTALGSWIAGQKEMVSRIHTVYGLKEWWNSIRRVWTGNTLPDMGNKLLLYHEPVPTTASEYEQSLFNTSERVLFQPSPPKGEYAPELYNPATGEVETWVETEFGRKNLLEGTSISTFIGSAVPHVEDTLNYQTTWAYQTTVGIIESYDYNH